MKRKILVLYWNPGRGTLRSAIQQHLHVFDQIADVEPTYFNAAWGAPSWLRSAGFEAVVLHTTLLCVRWSNWFPAMKWNLRWIADFGGATLAFPQDEYDHSEVLDEWLEELKVDVVFSNFEVAERRSIYPRLSDSGRFQKVFTGYVDDGCFSRARTNSSGFADRPKDLIYRASNLPYWFGSHGQLKSRLADVVCAHPAASDYTLDVSTRPEDVVLGERWFDFIASSRAVLGCESGSSALDRRGEIQQHVRWLLQACPNASFEEVSSQLPPGWDGYAFFALSPRHFEAAVMRTCQVLVRGDYEGVFQADRHYIPIDRDYGNLPEVFEKLRDIDLLESTADAAFEEIASNPDYRYSALAQTISEVFASIEQPASGPRRRPNSFRLTVAEWLGFMRYWWNLRPPLRSLPRRLLTRAKSLWWRAAAA